MLDPQLLDPHITPSLFLGKFGSASHFSVKILSARRLNAFGTRIKILPQHILYHSRLFIFLVLFQVFEPAKILQEECGIFQFYF